MGKKWNDRLTWALSVGSLGLLMVVLGTFIVGIPSPRNSITFWGMVLLFVGIMLIFGALAYALTKPYSEYPASSAPSARINDPNRAVDVARDSRVNASVGYFEAGATDAMPAPSLREKEN